jgi:RNA polymerase sigma-70 factor (ECF subfamily)
LSSSVGFLNAVTAAGESTDKGRVETVPSSAPKLADEAVMVRIQQGDREALGILFERYSRLVFGICARILRDVSEAQELVQDIFLYIFRKCEKFDPRKSSLRSWLVQVVYCRAFDRRDYLKCRRFYDYTNIEDVTDSIASKESLEDGVTARATLRRVLSELTERQRLTLELFFFEGRTLQEISVRLDQSLANTRNYYYRGLDKLRKILDLPAGTTKNGHP